MSYFLIPNRPPKNNKSIDEVIAGLKKTETAIPEVPPAPEITPKPGAPGQDDGSRATGLFARLASGNYLFKKISYQGSVIDDVEFCPQYLENGANKTQAGWAKFSAKNKNGWSVVDTEILYQCLLRAYAMRDDAQHQKTVQEFRQDLQKILDPAKPYIGTLSKVAYGVGLDAMVSSLGPSQNVTPVDEVPEFTKADDNWCYLVLAPEQPETNLGKTSPLPAKARPILKALLGKGYEQAGAVFQYFSTLKKTNLREARLWTPSATNRNQERVVALGVGNSGNFNIDADVSINDDRPALGVRCAKNFP